MLPFGFTNIKQINRKIRSALALKNSILLYQNGSAAMLATNLKHMGYYDYTAYAKFKVTQLFQFDID
jgi:hypothetical protein